MHFSVSDHFKIGAKRPYFLLVTKHSTCHLLSRFCRISNHTSDFRSNYGLSNSAISNCSWAVVRQYKFINPYQLTNAKSKVDI